MAEVLGQYLYTDFDGQPKCNLNNSRCWQYTLIIARGSTDDNICDRCPINLRNKKKNPPEPKKLFVL